MYINESKGPKNNERCDDDGAYAFLSKWIPIFSLL